jgi:hypothetical protein
MPDIETIDSKLRLMVAAQLQDDPSYRRGGPLGCTYATDNGAKTQSALMAAPNM